MKVKVVKKFRDKNSKEIVKAGTIIEDMGKERFEEIQKVGNFLEVLEEDQEPPEDSKQKTAKDHKQETAAVPEKKATGKSTKK